MNDLEFAYSQQKNREQIYEQARFEWIDILNRMLSDKESWIDTRYEDVCKQANIAPYQWPV